MDQLSLVNIIESLKNNKVRQSRNVPRVKFGSKIKLLDKQTFIYFRVTLIGPSDKMQGLEDINQPHSNTSNSGKVSYLSTLGAELMGALSGDHIRINVRGKSLDYQVLSIINTQLFPKEDVNYKTRRF